MGQLPTGGSNSELEPSLPVLFSIEHHVGYSQTCHMQRGRQSEWGREKVATEGHSDRKWSQRRRNCKCGCNALVEDKQELYQPGLLLILPEKILKSKLAPGLQMEKRARSLSMVLGQLGTHRQEM